MNNSFNFDHSNHSLGWEGKNKDSKQATGIQFHNWEETFISYICLYKIRAVYVSLYEREVVSNPNPTPTISEYPLMSLIIICKKKYPSSGSSTQLTWKIQFIWGVMQCDKLWISIISPPNLCMWRGEDNGMMRTVKRLLTFGPRTKGGVCFAWPDLPVIRLLLIFCLRLWQWVPSQPQRRLKTGRL